MGNADKSGIDTDSPDDLGADLSEIVAASDRLNSELSFLFDKETVMQASRIDIADLNLNDDMIASISSGVRQLKELKNKPHKQIDLVNGMSAGSRLVLCMWIMEMGLLEKIQSRSYLSDNS